MSMLLLRQLSTSSPRSIVLSLPFQSAQRFSTTSAKSSTTSSNAAAAKYFGRRNIQKGKHLESTTVNTKSTANQRWNQLAWIVKITRIPILIGAVYSLGYQQGVLDSVRNPNKIQQGSFESACMEMGVHSGEQIDIVWERRPPPSLSRLGWLRLFQQPDDNEENNVVKDPRANRVATIGREIIRAARKHISMELHKAVEKKKQELMLEQQARQQKDGKELTQYELLQELSKDEDVEKWNRAYEQIEGYTHDGIRNWQYILLQTPIPNAFVSEMLPQRVFVTTGLFDNFVQSDEELAMIMGHEISHLILGHGSERVVLEFMIRGLEIAFLMLDPTEGMLSLGIASFLASTRDALTASHSRDTEREADELGCRLAAMACYDTEKGSQVFQRMHDFDEKQGHAEKDIMSSHPASIERYEFVKELSKEVNPANYSYCGRLQAAMRGRALSIITTTASSK